MTENKHDHEEDERKPARTGVIPDNADPLRPKPTSMRNLWIEPSLIVNEFLTPEDARAAPCLLA